MKKIKLGRQFQGLCGYSFTNFMGLHYLDDKTFEHLISQYNAQVNDRIATGVNRANMTNIINIFKHNLTRK